MIVRSPAPQLFVLHPGDVACGLSGDRFETLLGSCVSVVLADSRRSVGAMCHIVHAATAPPSQSRPCAFADQAIAAMCTLVRGRGLDPASCEARVVGGGNMFPELVRGHHVGETNVRRVLSILQTCRIKVKGLDVGGENYRRLAWTVGPGEPEIVIIPVRAVNADKSLRH